MVNICFYYSIIIFIIYIFVINYAYKFNLKVLNNLFANFQRNVDCLVTIDISSGLHGNKTLTA